VDAKNGSGTVEFGGKGKHARETRNRIHERTISLRVLGIILRVLRLEVSVSNVDLTNNFKPLLLPRGGGVNPLVEVTCE
jgi:hypothetical protein